MWDLSELKDIRRWPVMHLLMCLTFVVSSLLINLVQISLYVTLRPINKTIYRRINYYLIYSIYIQVVFVAEWWAGCEVRVHTDPEDRAQWGRQSGLVLMNHSYEMDWLVGWWLADSARLLGAGKVFVKKALQYAPTIGWALRCSDIIFLNRNWEKDQLVIDSQLREFHNYPSPVWMLLYAEGTRFTPSKHAASMQFAKERGLPVLKRHLIPRTRGFVQCAKALQGHFPHIYDMTISFNTKEGVEPSLLAILRGEKLVAEVYVRRLPLSDVPTHDDEATSKYLHTLYQEKDRLLDSYCETGSFTETNDMSSYPPYTLPRRPYSLMNGVAWLSFLLYCAARFLYGASLVAQLAFVGVFLLAHFMLQQLIGLTKIDKGSQYGATAAGTSAADKSAPVDPVANTATKED